MRRRKPAIQCGVFTSMKAEVRFYDEDLTYEGIRLRVSGLIETYCLVCEHVWETEKQEQLNLELIRAVHSARLDLQLTLGNVLLEASEWYRSDAPRKTAVLISFSTRGFDVVWGVKFSLHHD